MVIKVKRQLDTQFTEEQEKHLRYGCVVDAGSSGSRIQIYAYLEPTYILEKLIESPEAAAEISPFVTEDGLPVIFQGSSKDDFDFQLKIEEGISTFADRVQDIGPNHVKLILDYAVSVIPPEKLDGTVFYLFATAGMRLLTQEQQDAILTEIYVYIKDHYPSFKMIDRATNIRVITGEEEGLFGWMSTNYLEHGFTPKEIKDGSESAIHTYNFIDMGGASTQIAYELDGTVKINGQEMSAVDAATQIGGSDVAKNIIHLTLHTLNTGDLILNDATTSLTQEELEIGTLDFNIYVITFLEYGVNETRRRYLEKFIEARKAEPAYQYLLKTGKVGKINDKEDTKKEKEKEKSKNKNKNKNKEDKKKGKDKEKNNKKGKREKKEELTDSIDNVVPDIFFDVSKNNIDLGDETEKIENLDDTEDDEKVNEVKDELKDDKDSETEEESETDNEDKTSTTSTSTATSSPTPSSTTTTTLSTPTTVNDEEGKIIWEDPCLPVGGRQDLIGPLNYVKMYGEKEGKLIEENVLIKGVGKYDECTKNVYQLLNDTEPCVTKSCLFNGMFSPVTSFEEDQFLGIGKYWDVINVYHLAGSYDYSDFQKASRDFCSKNWSDLAVEYDNGLYPDLRKPYDLALNCFRSSWMENMLHEGYNLSREDPSAIPLMTLAYVNGTEASWALGALLQQVSNEIGQIKADWNTTHVANSSLGQDSETVPTLSSTNILTAAGLFITSALGITLFRKKFRSNRRIEQQSHHNFDIDNEDMEGNTSISSSIEADAINLNSIHVDNK